MEKINKNQKDQRGQALLFVIVALTVALSVGISTSLRTLSSISRTSTTDTAARVLSAAEGGIEQFLSYDSDTLEAATADCASLDNPQADYCTIDFPTDSGDVIESKATVMVERYNGELTTGVYYTSLEQGTTSALSLANYSGNLELCWKGDTDVYYVLAASKDISNWQKGLVAGQDGNVCWTSTRCEGSVASTGSCSLAGFDRSITLSVPSVSDVRMLSIIPLNDWAEFAVIPAGGAGSFDILGYRITSRGELQQENAQVITKTVVAYRSLPYLPAGFLFGLFAENGITTNN